MPRPLDELFDPERLGRNFDRFAEGPPRPQPLAPEETMRVWGELQTHLKPYLPRCEGLIAVLTAIDETLRRLYPPRFAPPIEAPPGIEETVDELAEEASDDDDADDEEDDEEEDDDEDDEGEDDKGDEGEALDRAVLAELFDGLEDLLESLQEEL